MIENNTIFQPRVQCISIPIAKIKFFKRIQWGKNYAKDESLSDDLEGDELKTDLLGNSELSELEMTYSNRRQRRKPKWHSDYEFDYNP